MPNYKGFELSDREYAAIRNFELKGGYPMKAKGMRNWLTYFRKSLQIKDELKARVE